MHRSAYRTVLRTTLAGLMLASTGVRAAWAGGTGDSLSFSDASPPPASSWTLDPRTVHTPGAALLDVTLVGAAFGVVDRAGLYHVDHPVTAHTSGIWSIARTPTFPAELIGGTALAALWTGGQSRLGRTLWEGLDGAALAGASTAVLKYSFGRERPSQTSSPDQWSQGAHAQSFPSGDVAAITGLVTPAILEYRRQDPAVYLLAALPVFDMAARVEARGHWQTDVVGGALVGALSGYYAHRFTHPLILSLLPHGAEIGFGRRF
ncbi:MAG TPA: phosphatase PAP2 family protein [Acidiferrobacteraceae bacterium]|nr:phosphatase PAP2 family protein [Acidiferrobacteraceae bacterium]